MNSLALVFLCAATAAAVDRGPQRDLIRAALRDLAAEPPFRDKYEHTHLHYSIDGHTGQFTDDSSSRYNSLHINDYRPNNNHNPNCGPANGVLKRVKRFNIDLTVRWDHDNITWSFIDSTMPARLTRNQIVQEFTEAFLMWQKTTTWRNNTIIYFNQLPDNSDEADIKLAFKGGKHGDNNDFDGPGHILAHGFFPPRGDIHFDVDEEWTVSDEDDSASEKSIDLYSVALHEIGHSLGLRHSAVHEAVMYFSYNPTRRETHNDDRNGLTQLYGAKGDITTPPPTTTTSGPPENVYNETSNLFSNWPIADWTHEGVVQGLDPMCQVVPSCVAEIRGERYVFADHNMWRYSSDDKLLQNGSVRDIWPNVCSVEALAEINNMFLILTHGVWYEYDSHNLTRVGRVVDLVGTERSDALVVDANAEYFYVTYGGWVQRFDTTTKTRAGAPFELRHKFVGVGDRLEWFYVHEDRAYAGLGRGVWPVSVVSYSVPYGDVYHVIGDMLSPFAAC